MTITGDHRLLKRLNRVAILRCVRQRPESSRADVAAATGLTKSTVSLLSQELIDEGWLMELDNAETPGQARGSGRPPTPLRLDPHRLGLIGVDIGLGTIKAVGTNLLGEVLAERSAPLRSDTCEATCALAAELVAAIHASPGFGPRELVGVGVAVPGAMDDRTGLLRFAPNLGWRNMPLRQMLREALSGGPAADRPLYVQNDADVAALGEFEFGLQPVPEPLVFVMLGVGVGAGIVVNDQLLTGLGGFAGEIGHTVLQADGPPCRCGRRGCAEVFVGLPALERAGRLDDAGKQLGLLLQNVWAALDPAVIVLGGPSCELGDTFISQARLTLEGYAHAAGLTAPVVQSARFGALATPVGAAATVLHYQLRPLLDARVVQSPELTPGPA